MGNCPCEGPGGCDGPGESARPEKVKAGTEFLVLLALYKFSRGERCSPVALRRSSEVCVTVLDAGGLSDGPSLPSLACRVFFLSLIGVDAKNTSQQVNTCLQNGDAFFTEVKTRSTLLDSHWSRLSRDAKTGSNAAKRRQNGPLCLEQNRGFISHFFIPPLAR